jgi:hypothetical protein
VCREKGSRFGTFAFPLLFQPLPTPAVRACACFFVFVENRLTGGEPTHRQGGAVGPPAPQPPPTPPCPITHTHSPLPTPHPLTPPPTPGNFGFFSLTMEPPPHGTHTHTLRQSSLVPGRPRACTHTRARGLTRQGTREWHTGGGQRKEREERPRTCLLPLRPIVRPPLTPESPASPRSS